MSNRECPMPNECHDTPILRVSDCGVRNSALRHGMGAIPVRLRALQVVAAALALLNGGCLAAAVGACAAGAGVTCNAYAKGKVCHLYTTDLDDAVAAVRTALVDMGLAIEKEIVKPNTAFFRTRTGDGERIRIYLDREPSRIPADGSMTRISVRVGTFGDHPLSERVLFQIGAHLIPQPRGEVQGPASPPLPVTPPPTLPETAPLPRSL